MFTQKQLKKKSADAALILVKNLMNPNLVIGIGTGSTVDFFIESLEKLKHCFLGAIASSERSAKNLISKGIRLLDLNNSPDLPIYVDGADEINESLQLIKGGGGALTREKILASVAKHFVCIADESKFVKQLGKFPLPVEVIPMARETVSKALKALGGDPVFRSGFTTDNGNIILDVSNLRISKAADLESKINNIAGVVTCGLFAIPGPDTVILGTQNGVFHIEKNHVSQFIR